MPYPTNKDLREAFMQALERIKTQQNTGSAFYRSLKQPKGSNHGNRKPPSQAHSNPSVGASPAFPGAVTFSHTDTIIHSTPQIPNAGIRTGEIIGKRFWYVTVGGVLTSITSLTSWIPGGTIYGDVDQPLFISHVDNTLRYAGVYAFKLDHYIDNVAQWLRYHVINNSNYSGIVEGKIKLWGTVVEHEHGYRAKCAKMVSIDKVWVTRSVDLNPYYTALNQKPTEPKSCTHWENLDP